MLAFLAAQGSAVVATDEEVVTMNEKQGACSINYTDALGVLWGEDALGGAVMFQTLDPSHLLNRESGNALGVGYKARF